MPRKSISSRLNNTSRLTAVNTSEYTEMRLDTDSLAPSKENFYGIREIEALADNMLIAGHIEPIIVGKVDGAYRIISGHRRWQAAKMNKERGHEGFDKISCMVKEMSYNMFMYTLLSANAFTRKLSDYELVRQTELLREYTEKLKDEGLVIHGKMRDYLADTLGVSSSKIAQIDSINKNLSEDGKKAFESGKMNFSKAYETSRLPEEKQREVIEDDKLLSGDVKNIVREMKTRENKEKKSDLDAKRAEAPATRVAEAEPKEEWLPGVHEFPGVSEDVDVFMQQLSYLHKKMIDYENIYKLEEKNLQRKSNYEIVYEALKYYYTRISECVHHDFRKEHEGGRQ